MPDEHPSVGAVVSPTGSGSVAQVAGSPILIVEDDDDTRAALVELLEDHGYRVDSVRNGREAATYLRERSHPMCMLLDLWMPEMDGWTLAEEMRRGRLPKVPTVVITAAEPHWGYPVPLVVRKPVDSRRLLTVIRTVAPPPSRGQ